MVYAFLACFAFGFFYSVLSFIIGGLSGGGGSADVGGLDAGDLAGGEGVGAGLDAGIDAGLDAGIDAGLDAGLDAGADATLAGADAGPAQQAHAGGSEGAGPSPFNSLVISSFITVFGAVGLICDGGLSMGWFLSTAIALVTAAAVGAIVFFLVVRVLHGSQSDSSYSLGQIAGVRGKVITAVPAGGLGEVACVVNGTRCSYPASSAEGLPIRQGREVLVVKMERNVAIVSPLMEVDPAPEDGGGDGGEGPR